MNMSSRSLKTVTLTVITLMRCGNFELKCTEMRLAAGLCPDPLRELKRSPKPPSRE